MARAPHVTESRSEVAMNYIDRVMRMPLLSREEELRLTRLWRDSRDPKARIAVMEAHLKITVKIARQFARYGIPVEDLMDEGAAGLSRALDKFDPERGFRFVTYAGWWVRAAIMDYVLRTAHQTPMGTTAAFKKLFFGLRSTKARLGIHDDETLVESDIQAIANATGTTTAEVVEMERRLRSDISLDVPDPNTGRTMLEGMADDAPLPDQIFSDRQDLDIRMDLLSKAMDGLPPRERQILEARRLQDDPLTLEQLSQIHGVSRERIRQIEVKALDRLSKRVMELARRRRYLPIAA
jgi:RNA polymerase sigma-32 factor